MRPDSAQINNLFSQNSSNNTQVILIIFSKLKLYFL